MINVETLELEDVDQKDLELLRTKVYDEMNAREKKDYIENGRAHTTAMAGMCYKYRNSGGGSDKPWWLYIRVAAIVENEGYDVIITEQFQNSPAGWSKWETETYIIGPRFREPYWAEKPISLKEYQTAKGAFMAEMQTLAIAKEGAKD